MNWGYKILTVILVFITAMATMVTIAMRQKNELMEDQYYVRELKHQNIIDAGKNLASLPGKVMLSITADAVRVQLPWNAIQAITESSVVFIRLSDQSKDLSFPLAPDTNGVQDLPVRYFSKGFYKVRFSWSSNNIPYYSEQSFYFN